MKYGNRNYRYVKCELCQKYEHVATKHSKNETCPLASEILADERKQRLEIIIIIIIIIINEHFNVHTVNLINVMLNYTYK